MPKSLRTYIADLHREVPDELVCIDREVNPAGYDCTAIIKQLDAMTGPHHAQPASAAAEVAGAD